MFCAGVAVSEVSAGSEKTESVISVDISDELSDKTESEAVVFDCIVEELSILFTSEQPDNADRHKRAETAAIIRLFIYEFYILSLLNVIFDTFNIIA